MNKKDDKKLLQWHPAFYAGLQIEFEEESHKLEFENEHYLSKKPMQIDVLVIKKRTDDVIHKNIGRIFRKHNIIEYKSPDDYVSVDDFYKVCGYALFYKSEAKEIDNIKITELTITYVSMGYPEKLVQHLKGILGLGIAKKDEGIYYITKGKIPMQMIVVSELSEKENLWLRSLTNKLNDSKTIDKISKVYAKHQKDERYKAVMNVIVRANKEHFEEAKDMCEALREIWAEDFEKAKNEGLLENINRTIKSCKTIGASKEQMQDVLVANFELTEAQAQEYMQLYW